METLEMLGPKALLVMQGLLEDLAPWAIRVHLVYLEEWDLLDLSEAMVCLVLMVSRDLKVTPERRDPKDLKDSPDLQAIRVLVAPMVRSVQQGLLEQLAELVLMVWLDPVEIKETLEMKDSQDNKAPLDQQEFRVHEALLDELALLGSLDHLVSRDRLVSRVHEDLTDLRVIQEPRVSLVGRVSEACPEVRVREGQMVLTVTWETQGRRAVQE